MFASESKKNRDTALFGVVAPLVGLFIILISIDAIYADESQFNAPRWVVAAAGLFFFIAGLALIWNHGFSWSTESPILT